MAEDKVQEKYIKSLGEFTDELSRWGKDKFLWEYGEDYTRVRFYTNGHEYSIRATPTYLGCVVSSRKPRPGEDWTRGNDLADGKFNHQTWDAIIRDILAYELKSISDYVLNEKEQGDNLSRNDGVAQQP